MAYLFIMSMAAMAVANRKCFQLKSEIVARRTYNIKIHGGYSQYFFQAF